SQSPPGSCSTKPRSGCTGPPVSTVAPATWARSVSMSICASTSRSRYSDARLTIRPMAPSSLCWQISVTPREKFGSCRLGAAIRKWSLRKRRDSMPPSYRVPRPWPRRAAGCLPVAQHVAGQELPGAGDVQDVDVLGGFRDRRERLGQAHDAHRRFVEDGMAAGLDDVDALDAAVATHRHGHHQLAFEVAPACLVGVVEVADALHPGDPAAHIGRVLVLARVGGAELAIGTL